MSLEHKWEIGVNSGSYYQSLTQIFRGNDIGLTYEDDCTGMRFLAYSYHIDELDDPKDVSKRLFSLELLLNGALCVDWAKLYPLKTKFIYFTDINARDRHNIYAESIEEYPFSRNTRFDENFSMCDAAKTNFASYLLFLSKQSDELRTLLFLCGLISKNTPLEIILTWSTLYKIKDCIRHYSKQHGIQIDKIVNMTKLNEFTAACNNMSILGIFARHGAAGNTPPTRVMKSIDEAIELILNMANSFCHCFVKTK
jgi:hypothetical protein